jgi:hypothetical protein
MESLPQVNSLILFSFATVLLFRLLSSVSVQVFISPHFNTAIFRFQGIKTYQLVTSISLEEIDYSIYVYTWPTIKLMN